MPTQIYFTFDDYSAEKSTTRMWIHDISESPGAYAAAVGVLNGIRTQIERITMGPVRQQGISKWFPVSADLVLDKGAQREKKWLVTMQDTTPYLDVAGTIVNPGYLRLFSFELPTADLEYLAPNSDEIKYDYEDGDENLVVAEVMAALEADARSPWNYSSSAPVTTQVVKSIRFVGRAL